MKQFTPKTFIIPTLIGTSLQTTQEHLKLYAGYVTHANLILERAAQYGDDVSTHAYAINEIMRRFGFEYNGIRNHELYFSSLEGGPATLDIDSPLKQAIATEWGSFDAWLQQFKALALTRGVGWAILYHDRHDDRLLNAWVDEQHLGQLQHCTPLLALDMWEHSFVADYLPSGKKQYVEDFFKNVNWAVIEKNFTTSH